jgi:cytochrome c peroxidase
MMRKWTIAVSLVVFCFLATSASAQLLTPMEQLGKELYFDKISTPGNQSCASCHAPKTGFTGPTSGRNDKTAVYPGAVRKRFGNRKPPSAAYATVSPVFHFDTTEGLFIGGNFWDGRATGETLGNPAAEQALGPFLNPVEQNKASKVEVLQTVADSKYANLWTQVWGTAVSWDTQAAIDENYNQIGLAIAAFEGSIEVNQFSSKFDNFWRNLVGAGLDVTAIDMSNWGDYLGYGLTNNEVKGLALFNDEGKGMCALCHVLDSPEPGMPPLFTDFSFDNLGTPKNLDNPFYRMDEVYLDDGSPINPAGAAWVDPGLGGFLATHTNPAWQAMAAENMGKHKVPTLRNVGKAPNGEEKDVFIKAYMHNGVFKSLKEVVNFYNTRDVANWPPPEVAANVNTDELGNLGLTEAEELLIVLFMETLSDGWVPGGVVEDTPVAQAIPLDRPEVTPNPFNPTSTITFNVPTSGDVKLTVYNVSGQRVKTLVDGFKTAGTHQVLLVADELPSGVYFVRLVTAGQSTTRKAVLLK